MAAQATGGMLPWGWWLLIRSGWIEDREGRRWNSVRDAFWRGRLGFPGHPLPEQHELLLRVLTGLEFGWHRSAEREIDLFGGDMVLRRFYMGWLVSVGLVAAPEEQFASPQDITDEGRSVMLMLQATREPAWAELPMPSLVAAVRSMGRGSADRSREAALLAFEREVASQPFVFRREAIGRSFAATLVGMNTEARMPTHSVIWSMAFDSDADRDNLYAWLAERVDRWEEWGQLAYTKGSGALTQHILKVIVASTF